MELREESPGRSLAIDISCGGVNGWGERGAKDESEREQGKRISGKGKMAHFKKQGQKR
jgi:hypothetical protein